ncbi:hypothetical protein LINGRAHAP2_LOCUS22584 [Linum grandiflorum]
MGHKKRAVAPRSKHQSPHSAASAPAGDEAELCPDPNNNLSIVKIDPELECPGSSYGAIKLECERALTALRRGNHTKALRLMKESCSRHGDYSPHSALIYRVQGTVCVKVASIIDDPNAKQRHLRNAVDSARKAVELSPHSIEFSHFYANLLYEVANDGKEYDEVMRECDRALEILNPVDPAKESLQEENQQKIATAEARIAHVQGELRSLKQKSSIASISTWMKNLGTGEEIRLIPIRRATEDPMEARLSQTRRPNEIKKATKTPEERRKEIEVRVAAARLLQQKSDTDLGRNDGERNNNDKGVELSSGNEKRGERRKYGSNAKRTGTNTERKDWVRSYWNSMRTDMKKELLKIRVSDLQGYFGLSKDGLASEVLNEALTFEEGEIGWRCWVCCRCAQKFPISEKHVQHVVQEHLGNLDPKMRAVLPQNVESSWIQMIMNYSWKPLDVSSATKMLEHQRKFQDPEPALDYSLETHDGECDDYKDAWDSSPEKENLGDGCSESSNGGKDTDGGADSECRECNGKEVSLAYSIDSWPLSDDSERAKLLERIHDVFESLISHKYLATSHIDKVLQITKDELRTLASGSQLLTHGLDDTPILICFLEASQLRRILKFLQDLAHACGLSRYSEKGNAMDNRNDGVHVAEYKEDLVLNGDGSYLYLDESLLASECAREDDTTLSSSNPGKGVPSDTDSLLSWIFSGPSSNDQLQLWMRTKEEKVQQGMDIVQNLEKEFYHLQSLCERKCEHLSYEEALQTVETFCREEVRNRDDMTLSEIESCDSILRRRRDELANSVNDAMLSDRSSELDVISSILKEAETLNVNHFGYEDNYGAMASQLCDLESGENSDGRGNDYIHQMDSFIEVAIEKQKDQLSVELSKIDVRIMRIVSGMQHLELKLEPVSARDYQSILLPLVKSYLRAHLEDLAEKDATEKSDAAREAFLAELALDSKKAAQGGNDTSRNSQEKKDKKRNKELKKTKDYKGSFGNEQPRLHDETTEHETFALSSEGDLEAEILPSSNGVDLRQQEEEFRRKIELEEEERKLEETLEFQRRIENEAKLKHLAEQQNKRAYKTFPDNVVEGQRDGSLEQPANKENNSSIMGPLAKTNGLSSKLGVGRSTAGNASELLSESFRMPGSEAPDKLNQGLPNGVTMENGVLSSDRRTGRRARRQKSSSRSADSNCQLISAENSNTEAVTVNLGSEDTGSKTLRQLRVEEDDEERFQEDLKKAVRQSLDTFQSHESIPSVPRSRMPPKTTLEAKSSGSLQHEVTVEQENGADVFGSGLKNEVGEYNCFLNVIIQLSLYGI